jgi:hypothetical protein
MKFARTLEGTFPATTEKFLAPSSSLHAYMVNSTSSA